MRRNGWFPEKHGLFQKRKRGCHDQTMLNTFALSINVHYFQDYILTIDVNNGGILYFKLKMEYGEIRRKDSNKQILLMYLLLRKIR